MMNDLENWQPIYRELSEVFGLELAQKFYQQYRGMTVIFPMHLLSKQGTIRAVKQDAVTGMTNRALSRKYDLSQRTIQRYIEL